jgi:hypothetical protein
MCFVLCWQLKIVSADQFAVNPLVHHIIWFCVAVILEVIPLIALALQSIWCELFCLIHCVVTLYIVTIKLTCEVCV